MDQAGITNVSGAVFFLLTSVTFNNVASVIFVSICGGFLNWFRIEVSKMMILKGHCHEHNFKNSTAQKHVYTIGKKITLFKCQYI